MNDLNIDPALTSTIDLANEFDKRSKYSWCFNRACLNLFCFEHKITINTTDIFIDILWTELRDNINS